MAGTATHIAIADKMYTILGNGIIRNLPLFYGGNIAPDAIHAKPDYQRADKKHTHLTESMSGDDFQNPEKVEMYYGRVNEFIRNYYNPSDETRDLYLGYGVHLLTDALFNITVRKRFVEAMAKDGIDQHETEFFNRIMKDISNVDYILVSQYQYKQNVVSILESIWDYEIKDYVSAKEVNTSKRWVIDSFFKGEYPNVIARYYSYDEAVTFIDSTVDDVINHLSANRVI